MIRTSARTSVPDVPTPILAGCNADLPPEGPREVGRITIAQLICNLGHWQASITQQRTGPFAPDTLHQVKKALAIPGEPAVQRARCQVEHPREVVKRWQTAVDFTQHHCYPIRQPRPRRPLEYRCPHHFEASSSRTSSCSPAAPVSSLPGRCTRQSSSGIYRHSLLSLLSPKRWQGLPPCSGVCLPYFATHSSWNGLARRLQSPIEAVNAN